jgi:N-acylneuraminate cytidylyltransferase
MRIVAIIPARGGSVGLPGKNIRPLNGTPLVGRSVLAAKHSEHVSDVYVSSDARDILDVSRTFGALEIVRPSEISDSTASSEAAVTHALREIERTTGILPDIAVFLQCTSPFTTSRQIDELVSRLISQGADSAFSAIEDHGFIWQIAEDGTARGITHDETLPRQRRQDMAPRYRENGAIYAMRVGPYLASGSRFCGRNILVATDMPPIEIDTPDDWAIAEMFASAHDKQHVFHGALIKAIVTDFDGVHTDDKVTITQDGNELVRCSRADGMGIEILRNRGLRMLILSREQNPIVRSRAAKLKMEVQHHVVDKLPALDAWRNANNLTWSEIAYIGNDINDVECMKACGLSFSPSDAHESARSIAGIVLTKRGGSGAIREMSDYLLANGLTI